MYNTEERESEMQWCMRVCAHVCNFKRETNVLYSKAEVCTG